MQQGWPREATEPGGDGYLSVADLTKSFAVPGSEGAHHLVLDNVSVDVKKGEFVSILGPSGCGKSTLLKIMGGLETADSGRVSVAGHEVVDCPPEAVYVFQDYTKSLFPWLTVSSNIEFGITHKQRQQKRLTKREITERATRFSAHVGLEGFDNYYPWQLSGGMQQRVAIARALACQSDVLLMDEPFSAVDSLTRAALQDLILQVWRDFGMTVVFVTHDPDEAIYLSQRVLVMRRSPATVEAELIVPLGAERDQLETHADPKFVACRHDLMQRLMSSAGQRSDRPTEGPVQ